MFVCLLFLLFFVSVSLCFPFCSFRFVLFLFSLVVAFPPRHNE